MILILLIVLIAAVDLCIKEEIEAKDASFFPKELGGTKGRIILHKSHNTGFPFEVLKNRPELVRMVPVVVISALSGILCFLIPKKGYRAEKLALVLTLGGAFSNLYDRLVRHYVVDYFSINIKQLKKVIFNLGDMFIFLGAAVVLLTQLAQEIVELWKGIRPGRQ